jgi:hypothetical protein
MSPFAARLTSLDDYPAVGYTGDPGADGGAVPAQCAAAEQPMGAGIFVIRPDGKLTGLAEAAYDSEAVLQELLARYPELLAGDQIDPESPRRWLFITREIGVPDEPHGAPRWSLDHLFIDQEAIPTLVEVKRSTDTRIRREVVGQILDYAANAVLHWPVETIRAEFERRCEKAGTEPVLALTALLGPGGSAEVFWSQVKTNLQAGRIRLLFVADEIPMELRRIVEFLNGQMNLAEVLAVEVRQFAGEGLRTLVPRVYGRTAQSDDSKDRGGTGRPRRWDEASFFAKLAERGEARELTVAKELFRWAGERVGNIDYGNGAKIASFIPAWYGRGDVWFCPFRVYTGTTAAYVEIPLGGAGMQAAPFDDTERKRDLIRRINAALRLQLAEDMTRYPSITLVSLSQGEHLRTFLGIMDEAMAAVKAAPRGQPQAP